MFCFACKLYLRTELNPGQYLLMSVFEVLPKGLTHHRKKIIPYGFYGPFYVFSQSGLNQCGTNISEMKLFGKNEVFEIEMCPCV